MDRLTRSLFVKAVVLLPYLLSNVLVALVWLWLLDPVLGVVNHALTALGSGPQPFFAGPDQALLSVAAVNVWRHMGLVAMLFLAILLVKTLQGACTRPPRWKAPVNGRAFAASPCRCCGR